MGQKAFNIHNMAYTIIMIITTITIVITIFCYHYYCYYYEVLFPSTPAGLCLRERLALRSRAPGRRQTKQQEASSRRVISSGVMWYPITSGARSGGVYVLRSRCSLMKYFVESAHDVSTRLSMVSLGIT